MKSQAVVVKEVNGSWDIDDIEVTDQLDANEILVSVVASGACHSDLSLHNGLVKSPSPQSELPGLTLPLSRTIPYPFPSVFGHEGSGHVVRVGSNVKRVKEGDKVCKHSPFLSSHDLNPRPTLGAPLLVLLSHLPHVR